MLNLYGVEWNDLFPHFSILLTYFIWFFDFLIYFTCITGFGIWSLMTCPCPGLCCKQYFSYVEAQICRTLSNSRQQVVSSRVSCAFQWLENCLSIQQRLGTFFALGKDKAAKGEGWALPFISCPKDTVGLKPPLPLRLLGYGKPLPLSDPIRMTLRFCYTY